MFAVTDTMTRYERRETQAGSFRSLRCKRVICVPQDNYRLGHSLVSSRDKNDLKLPNCKASDTTARSKHQEMSTFNMPQCNFANRLQLLVGNFPRFLICM